MKKEYITDTFSIGEGDDVMFGIETPIEFLKDIDIQAGDKIVWAIDEESGIATISKLRETK